jgi:plastocyanin
MRQRTFIALVVAIAATTTGAIAGRAAATPGHAASVRVVTLRKIAFHPARLVVTRGTSVRFSWKDPGIVHNVTSTGRRRFRSSSTKKTGTYTVRFTRAGTYTYVCTIHFGMKGRVVVKG